MREGLVGLGHLVRVLALLHRGAPVVGGIQQLSREPIHHRLLGAAAGILDDPPDGQGLSALGPNLYWDLIGGAADPARANLELRLYVVEGIAEELDGIGTHL